MNSNSPLARVATLGVTVISAVLALPSALAQQAGRQGESLEEVVITGSRIRQNPLEERLPVMSLSTEDYRASGATSLADFVQKLPIAGSAINRTNNSSGNLGYPPDGGGIGAGAAEIDLRYLASKRVLVLVDGRRWIKGSSGLGCVRGGRPKFDSRQCNPVDRDSAGWRFGHLWHGRHRRRAQRHYDE